MRANALLPVAVVAALATTAAPAAAAVVIGTQIVATQLQGTIAAESFVDTGSDAGTRAGTIAAVAQLFERRADAAGVQALSSVVASLTGTTRGRVTFRRTLGVTGDAAAGGSADYVYFFSTDTPTAFDLDWGVSADGGDPAQVALVRRRDTGEELLRTAPLGDGSSGTAAVLLQPASYEFRIGDARSPRVDPARPGAGLSSQYSFTFRAVPEPAAWAMMTLGFAATGLAMRRRRTTRVARPTGQ